MQRMCGQSAGLGSESCWEEPDFRAPTGGVHSNSSVSSALAVEWKGEESGERLPGVNGQAMLVRSWGRMVLQCGTGCSQSVGGRAGHGVGLAYRERGQAHPPPGSRLSVHAARPRAAGRLATPAG